MLGLGETGEELQYLATCVSRGLTCSPWASTCNPRGGTGVEGFVPPSEFELLREEALALGYLYVAAGPLVRSSYRAAEFFMEAMLHRGTVGLDLEPRSYRGRLMAAQIELSKSERARAKPVVKRVDDAKVLPFADELALSLTLDAAMLAWQRRGQLGFFVPVEEWAQVLAAAVAASRPDELIFPGVREGRLALLRGLPLVDYLRQHLGLDGADADFSQSQAGHAAPGTIASAKYRVASAGGGAGAHLPHAVGAALAARALKRPEAILALAGSAAADTDDCHVALNFAAVCAPVVFLSRSERGAAAGQLVKRATGYAIPAEQVSGDDPAALQRRLGDLMGAVAPARGRRFWRSPTPLNALPTWLERLGLAVLAVARARCEEAFREALQGRRPGLASMTLGVFSEPTWPLLAQARELAGEQSVNPEEV